MSVQEIPDMWPKSNAQFKLADTYVPTMALFYDISAVKCFGCVSAKLESFYALKNLRYDGGSARRDLLCQWIFLALADAIEDSFCIDSEDCCLLESSAESFNSSWTIFLVT